ncbi:MAG: cation:proton antiporter subunit C [Bacteroidales bacterium]|nr:cation:proton antiporter subunit C [Bacteroidales bacterium]
MKYFNIEYISMATGLFLFLVGLWGIISQKNIIKIIISFSVLDTSIHLILVSIGYIRNKTAPIIDGVVSKTDAATKIVDPLPQALVLTAIVIGVGVTALMLTYALRMYSENKTLEINKYKSLKW